MSLSYKKISGSAFNENKFKGNRIKYNFSGKTKINYVSLTQWCRENFISKTKGKDLLKKRLLIGQRLNGQWWVCANKDCLEDLLLYLDLDKLFFDANNN